MANLSPCPNQLCEGFCSMTAGHTSETWHILICPFPLTYAASPLDTGSAGPFKTPSGGYECARPALDSRARCTLRIIGPSQRGLL